MAYKRFVYKNGKKFGPYYYESFRDADGNVQKRYVGNEDPDFVKKKKVVPTNVSKFFMIVGFLFLLFSCLMIFNGVHENVFSGFVVSDEISRQEFMEEGVGLDVLDAPEYVNAVSKNKNKRMEFNVGDEKIRLYFDLINYSEFTKEIAQELEFDYETNQTDLILEENITEILDEVNETLENITEVLEEETNLTIILENETSLNNTNLTIDLNETSTNEILDNITTNVTVDEAEESESQEDEITEEINQTQEEDSDEIGAEEDDDDEVLPSVPQSDDEESESALLSVPQSDDELGSALLSVPQSDDELESALLSVPQSDDELGGKDESEEEPETPITGNAIRFFGILGRVIGIDLEETEGSFEGESSNVVTQKIEVNQSEIKEKANELSNEELRVIEEKTEIELENDEFEINVSTIGENESASGDQGYKWGYSVELKDLKFFAKIDITSKNDLTIYNNHTIQIGRNLLSFEDLVKEGYRVTLEKPILEIEEDVFVEVDLTSDSLEESTKEADLNNVELTNESDEEILGNSTEVDEEEEISPDVIRDGDNESEGPQTGILGSITGNFIKGITGFAVADFEEEIDDTYYGYTLTLYIERDFTNNSEGILVGDIIYLDPTLIIIPISDAEELDNNRSFIRNIYNETVTQDDVWVDVNDSNYVRASFTEALDRGKDVSVYARVNDVCSSGAEGQIVLINGIEVPCEIYEKKKRVDELRRLVG
jgi:hypothetical protein